MTSKEPIMIASVLARLWTALLIVLSLGFAAQSANTPQPSPQAIALAKELIFLKGGQQMFGPVVPGVIESTKDVFLPTNPNLSKPLGEVSAQLKSEYASKSDELMNEVAKVYATHFTEQELKEIVAFYKTALGKKLLNEDPIAIEAGFTRAKEWANDFSNQVMTKMRAEMKKKGYDL